MTLNIPKLQYTIPMVLSSGVPTQTFQRWWQEVADNIVTSVNGLADAVADITTLQTQMNDRITEIAAIQSDLSDQLAQIIAAQNAAAAAQTSADNAQTTASTAEKNDKISASVTSPSQVLSAFDAGSDATINLAAHTRLYGDNTTLPGIASATFTGCAYGTTYAVYYDDPTTSNTSPTYVLTTILSDAMFNRADGRHFVGQITTPIAGGGSTSGGLMPPGGGGPYP